MKCKTFLAQEREGIILTVKKKFILNETLWLYIHVGFFLFFQGEGVVGRPVLCVCVFQ